MKNLLLSATLILSSTDVLAEQSSSADISIALEAKERAAAIYQDISNGVDGIFKVAESKDEILDNGYFSSAVYYGESIEYATYYATPLFEKEEVLTAAEESLFTVFAYASPDQALKTKLAGKFGKLLEWIETKYEVSLNVSQGNIPFLTLGDDLIRESLMESCAVGGPDKRLYVQIDGSYSMLVISSDVCD